MKGKPRKGPSGGSTLTVPLMLMAAIMAGFFFVIYILHISHVSTSDILSSTSNKFTIVEREVPDRLDLMQSDTRSSLTLRLRATDVPTTHPTKQRVVPEATSPNDNGIVVPASAGLAVKSILDQHPFHSLSPVERSHMSLEDHFVYLRNQSVCKDTPIFTSMANVFSDLYWQLIENFVYTMAKFDVSSCTIMVCVSDPLCMKLCSESSFPCYDYQHSAYHPNEPLPSALEQIGELKLLHLPKALAKGVDVLMLDLDVGFIDSPLNIVRKLHNSKKDIFVQKDLTFVMNRTVEGWRTWYTEPMPNIGIMLCRGNDKTAKMFDIAWKDYKAITKPIKHNPGKDQNKVVYAMRVSRGRHGLKWEYLPKQSTVLLDKIYKFEHITTNELGGEAADRVLRDKGADAVHTTCYEQKSKVMGLKAANAFWNPNYYDPHRRTLTKQLVYLSDAQLRWEVRTLLYLGMVSNRSVIIPNVLGTEMSDVELYEGNALWPGFRVAYFKKGFPYKVNILEPAYYWRVRRDYSGSDTAGENKKNVHAPRASAVPNVTLLSLVGAAARSINALERMLLSDQYHSTERIVLYAPSSSEKEAFKDSPTLKNAAEVGHQIDHHTIERVVKWAEDSVGLYPQKYDVETKRYGQLPQLGGPNSNSVISQLSEPHIAQTIIDQVRLCDQVHHPNLGNRSCFDKCK